jgi:hypothetical protein
MRIDPDHCDDPVLLAAEVRRLRAVIASGDYLKADNAAKRDKALQVLAELDEELGLPRTPNPHATPDECTVSPEWKSRPYWVDPPSGWRYGFPRLYDPARDGNMRAWMIASGYPERLANQGLDCTFTAQTEDVG